MTSSTTFGRRVATASPVKPVPTAEVEDPRLEALRREMAVGKGGSSGFQAWRKEEELGRWLSWFAAFALLTPGVICFMAHAPSSISGTLEVGGVIGGWWLRRERKRRLAAIRDWAPDDFA